MNLNTSINVLNYLVSEGLQGTIYECIKPIKFKIDDIDPKGRFVNLFGDFSPLWGVAPLVHWALGYSVAVFEISSQHHIKHTLFINFFSNRDYNHRPWRLSNDCYINKTRKYTNGSTTT